jgi:hypothetical protein
MKAKITLVMFSLFLILTVWHVNAAIDDKSVVAIWLFDENGGNVAKDSSGNGHDGEIKGSLKWINGPFFSALEFPGQAGSFVLVPHGDGFNLLTFTMIAWIKTENTGQRQEIIMKRKEGGTNSQNLHLQIESGRTSLDVGFTADNQWATGLFGKTDITTGNWFHIAATYDKEIMRLYVNGVDDGQQPRTTKPDTNDAPLTIGAVFATGITPLKGSLDDLGIFNVALKEEDINSIMKDGLKKTIGAKAVNHLSKLSAEWGKIKTQ